MNKEQAEIRLRRKLQQKPNIFRLLLLAKVFRVHYNDRTGCIQQRLNYWNPLAWIYFVFGTLYLCLQYIFERGNPFDVFVSPDKEEYNQKLKYIEILKVFFNNEV